MVTRQFRKHCEEHSNYLLQVISPVQSLEASLESRELESVCALDENNTAYIHIYIYIHMLHIYTTDL